MKPRSIVLAIFAVLAIAVAGFYIYVCYFWTPDIQPLRQLGDLVVSKAAAALKPLEDVSVIVVYDEDGRISLRGPSVKNGRTYDNIGELRSALSALHGKGSALIMELDSTPGKVPGAEGIQALVSSPPAVNFELENQIRGALIAAGLTPANNPEPTYNLHRIPAPPN
jgi:hypothetical protein